MTVAYFKYTHNTLNSITYSLTEFKIGKKECAI